MDELKSVSSNKGVGEETMVKLTRTTHLLFSLRCYYIKMVHKLIFMTYVREGSCISLVDFED